MKPQLLLFLFLVGCVGVAKSQNTDSDNAKGLHLSRSSRTASYCADSLHRGYFQKAYTDRSDPRFMVVNEDETFAFGVGGTIHNTLFYDFEGSVNNTTFTTWNIPVPTDYAGHFGLSLGSSKLNVKAKGRLGKRNVVAFIEIGPAPTGNTINLRHAYFSYGGLTVGQTYSFFMDLAAGPQTVDLEGPNTQVNMRHPLVGYTFSWNNRWSVGAALERQELGSISDENYNISDEFQELPDFASRISFTGKKGHIQFATILRTLYYYNENYTSLSLPSPPPSKIGTRSRIGFGAALSGSLKLPYLCTFSFQCVGGRGISSYIQDLSHAKLDLLRMSDTINKVRELNTAPVLGGYVSLQHDFLSKFTISFTYGYTSLFYMKDYYYEPVDCGNFKNSGYFAASFFWNVNDYFVLGAEYLYGQRSNRLPNESTIFGEANRFDMMLMYSF